MDERKKFRLADVILSVICVVFVAEAAAPVASIGNSQYFWWLFMMVAFLLPYGMISSELGTAYPGDGGLYDWIHKAFPETKWGARASWYYWINFPLWMASLAVVCPELLSVLTGLRFGWGAKLLIELAFIWVITWIACYPVCDSILILNISAAIKMLLALTVGVLGIVYVARSGFVNDMAPRTFLPVIILGGIFSGIFSITEASGVAVVYSAIIAFFVNRSVKLKDIPDMIIEAASTSGLVLILAGAGTAMAWGIANERVMSLLIEPLSQMPQWGFLLLVNGLLLVCGMFMDDYASTVILAPIIAPIAWAIGINPLHIGLVFCINLVVGLATPPFGVTLFVTSPIAGVRIEQTAKEALPFLITTIAILLLVTFVPDIALWLPESMGYLS